MNRSQTLELHARAIRLLAMAVIPLILITASWAASKETVLYTFQGGADGDFSLASSTRRPEGFDPSTVQANPHQAGLMERNHPAYLRLLLQ
jgi:hypothetical protein